MRKWVSICIVFTLMANGVAWGADAVKIGVLAKRGAVKAMQQWKATADYLNDKVDGATFEIVPLDFDEVNPAVEGRKVDFFLVNSSMFVTTKVRYGTEAITTMVNSRQGQPLESFGGVILTQADNDEISSLADLKGKTFMAVEESSFGGWQMAYKEMADAGVDPMADMAALEFGGNHDNVVLAVMNAAVDAGTVRTDTLERMQAEGLIDMADFKVINKQALDDFPFVCSTQLYPEWPMAKIAGTPDALAQQVAVALEQMKSDDAAAKAAKVVGWVKALDYTPVEELQKALGVGAYASE